MSGESARECRHCGADYKPEYNDCPNCGTGFFMPPVSGERACEDCGEQFAEEEYECPDCGSSFVSTA
jgi:RNA polymerase subunit RPABC4/transcription elongation factor Spt4